MRIEIRPRRVTDPRFDLDIYMSIDNLGVADLEKAYNDLTSNQTQNFSPFDKLSYELQLQLAATHLDPKGAYWSEQIKTEDCRLPVAGEELRITNSWVLFARPRSKSIFIQDLENFKKKFNDNQDCELSNVVKAIIKEPLSEHRVLKLPNFRGLSSLGYSNSEDIESITELFFPLPFNAEQVKVVQKLECSDGVVVQGPPGTGKTHTIANIISHYMANGKRVLVTSMKEPALSVLKEKLPKSIQPLAISLLTNEQDGVKQFEFAVSKMAQELQVIDRSVLEDEIKNAELHIDQLHAKLAWIDRSASAWAKKNIQPIFMDGQSIRPEEAAREVQRVLSQFEWLDDDISITDKNILRIDNTDVIHLREARRHLQNDLDYLGKKIPKIEEMSDLNDILPLHRKLLKDKELQGLIESSNIPQIENIPDTILVIERILDIFYELEAVKKQLNVANKPWVELSKLLLDNSDATEIIVLFEKLFDEIKDFSLEKNKFLEKPVYLPDDLFLTEEVIQAIYNKSLGKFSFGIAGAFSKRTLIKKIDEIHILNKLIKTSQEWEYIYRYVLFQSRLNTFVLRWNKLVDETLIFSPIDIKSNAIINGVKEEIEIYVNVKKLIELRLNFRKDFLILFHAWPYHDEILENEIRLNELVNFLKINLDHHRFLKEQSKKEIIVNKLKNCTGRISELIKKFIGENIGNQPFTELEIKSQWSYFLDELVRIESLRPYLDDVESISNLILESGGVNWSKKLRANPLKDTVDYLLPDNWQQAWRFCRLRNYLRSVTYFDEFKKLTSQRYEAEKQLAKSYQEVVAKRTWLKLANNATPDIRAALQAFRSAIAKIGKGTGKRAVRYRRDAKNAAALTNKAIPCWIMPHYRVSESLPAEFGCFDLVVIDEASQSDLSALPAILRANKLLVVRDDKQVSPGGIGLEEEKINNLMIRFLSNQVEIYRQAISPERSVYDLCKIVFADSQVMLREHFRCVSPIIEYSKREFYNHELKPLRLPTESERLDPPLVDVLIEDGYRNNKENIAEAQFIVDEIKKICGDPNMDNRTIGIVSLLGNEQSRKIWEILQNEISPDKLISHKITCGDALTFQGKERDIMFLSMVVTKDNNKADSREASAQRFNVAASRARDKMYLIRSVELGDLSPTDKLRRRLIEHFSLPFAQDEVNVKNFRDLCESGFECEIYDLLTERGYKVLPQVKVGTFRIDMVVEGHNDARLAIECDGDRYHDISRWEDDMNRQRILERAGWKFWRSFASIFVMNREGVVQDLLNTLTVQGIEPIGSNGIVNSIHSEQRRVKVLMN